jgi:hypothetical protein
MSPWVLGLFRCSRSAHENDGFHPLHLVIPGARGCRVCNLLPRISDLEWAEAAQDAGLRRLCRRSGLAVGGWAGACAGSGCL